MPNLFRNLGSQGLTKRTYCVQPLLEMFKKGTRGRAVLGSFVFFLAAPAVIAGAIPFALVGWTMELPLLGLPGERLVGIVAVGAGLVGLLDCFARFALEGRGTPSPVEQTEVLVVSGLYRFVRNPMYVCVLAMVAGQALLFGKAWLLPYAGVLLTQVYQLEGIWGLEWWRFGVPARASP